MSARRDIGEEDTYDPLELSGADGGRYCKWFTTELGVRMGVKFGGIEDEEKVLL